jgi:hypothetical protein
MVIFNLNSETEACFYEDMEIGRVWILLQKMRITRKFSPLRAINALSEKIIDISQTVSHVKTLLLKTNVL